jgi:ribose transport system substrate-binding protein
MEHIHEGRQRLRRWRTLAAGGTVAMALAVAVTGCGSSHKGSGNSGAAATSGSTSGGSSDPGSAGFAKAAALAKTYSKPPASTGVTAAIGKKVPTGKHIVFVGAGQSAVGTNTSYVGFQQAMKILGWTLTEVQPAEPTPADLQQALSTAIRDKPDAVVISAIAEAGITTQLKQLKAMHIPVVSFFGPDPAGGLLTAQVDGVPGQELLTAAVADKALADMGSPGEIGIIGLQGYSIVQKYTAGFLGQVHKLCPSCTIKTTLVPLQDLGTNDGQDIVNFVRANPKIKALFVGYDGMDANLFSAAKSAGVTLPKTYSSGTLPTSIQNIASGALTASAPIDYYEVGFRVADSLVRIFTGQSNTLGEDVGSHYERPTVWSKSFGNVPPAPSGNAFPSVVKSYQQQYKKLWGK